MTAVRTTTCSPTTAQPHTSSASSSLTASAAMCAHNFATITCVTWSPSGRTIALGTPSGFLVYSTDAVHSLPHHHHHHRDDGDNDDDDMQSSDGNKRRRGNNNNSSAAAAAQQQDVDAVVEVCRCVVDGGVGLLGVYEQCSVVAYSGLRGCDGANVVTLCDVERGTFAATTTTASSSLSYSSSLLCVPRVLAESFFAHSVVVLRFCPDMVLVGVCGEAHAAPAASHTLYIFDGQLRQQRRLCVYPPSHVRYLNDAVALATRWQHSRDAGVCVARLRALLPGARCGEVRLLTRIRRCRDDGGTTVSAAAAATHDADDNEEDDWYAGEDSDTGAAAAAAARARDTTPRHVRADGAGDDVLALAERVLHQSRLRVVALTHDGHKGVTMGESGTKIRLLHFAGDATMHICATLERGRLAGVVQAASLAVCTLTRRAASVQTQLSPCSAAAAAAAHTATAMASVDVVACVTSTGTVHVFMCSTDDYNNRSSSGHHALTRSTARVLYTRNKRLAPRGRGFPYAYMLHITPQYAHDSGAVFVVVSVLQWTNAHSTRCGVAVAASSSTRTRHRHHHDSSNNSSMRARLCARDDDDAVAAVTGDAMRLVCFRVTATLASTTTTLTTSTRTTSNSNNSHNNNNSERSAAASWPASPHSSSSSLLHCTWLRQYGIDHS